MESKKVNELAKILKENGLSRLEYTHDDGTLILESVRTEQVMQTSSVETTVNATQTVCELPKVESQTKSENGYIQKAPLVGTVYLSNAPTDPPLVIQGQQINEGDAICVIESMKMFNTIVAEKSGVVDEIFIENGQLLEYGQPLISITT